MIQPLKIRDILSIFVFTHFIRDNDSFLLSTLREIELSLYSFGQIVCYFELSNECQLFSFRLNRFAIYPYLQPTLIDLSQFNTFFLGMTEWLNKMNQKE